LWTIIAVALGAACLVYLLDGNLGSKILGIAGAALFFGVAAILLRQLLVPRDLLRVGPDGIDQRAVRPHVLIRWDEIVDIRAIDRGHRVQTLGITVRVPSALPQHGQLNPIGRSRWIPRGAKFLLAGTQLLSEGPLGITDALDTLQSDASRHATFEISTVAFPMNTEQLVGLLRARWSAAVRPDPPPAKNGPPPR
jgi:hypothetical protein